MKSITLYLLLCLSAASGLTAQVALPNRPEYTTILVNAELLMDGKPLSLSLGVVGPLKLRASIRDEATGIEVSYVYNEQKLTVVLGLPDNSFEPIENSADDAVAVLVDLLSLNPEFHFGPGVVANIFSEPIFEGYSVEIKNYPQEPDSEEKPLCQSIRLFRNDEAQSTLIRSIEMLNYFPAVQPYAQPQELAFTDETTGESGQIIVRNVQYNPGIPEFLFELPEIPGTESIIKQPASIKPIEIEISKSFLPSFSEPFLEF